MSCNHKWSEECYDVVPSQVCVRCNAFQVEEEHAELVRDAFRRGSEAMRVRCEEIARHTCSVIGKLEHTYGIMTQGHVETVSRLILEADIPEEP